MTIEKYPHDVTPIIGLAVVPQFACRKCGSNDAVIGPGVGQHSASLRCRCGAWLDWLRWETADFIIDVVTRFGRPSEPIIIPKRTATSGTTAVSSTSSAHQRGQNMSIYDLIPSRFIKTSDLTTPINVVIESVSREKVGDEEKPVVRFRDGKEMVLNLTRIDSIVQLYGDNERDWKGRSIQLRAGTTRFQGKAVGCIEVHPPQQTGGRSILPPNDDEDVPF